MKDYKLISKANTIKEIKNERATIDLILKPISREKWVKYINSQPDLFWYVDSPLGQLHKNHPESPLDPNLYYAIAYYDYDKKKEHSDTEIRFPLHSQYITFKFPRTTVQRLEMMWRMAEALDCYLTAGFRNTVITPTKFEKLKDKYSLNKRGKKE